MNSDFFCSRSIGLLILAGGRSTRMGKDKAGLMLDGKTFASTIADNMKYFDEKLVSAFSGYVLEGFETVTDEPEIEGKGPMAGIVSGLAVCRSRWLLTVPCDMPFFDIGAAGKLAMAIDMSDPRPVTAEGKNGKVPLPGIYPKDTADKIRGFLMQGIYRASDILEQIGSSMVKIDEKSLININTPEEYAIYGKR